MSDELHHPTWCVPKYCTVRRPDRPGSHASAPLEIRRPSGTMALYLNATPNGPTLILVEHVPEIVEPDVDVPSVVVGLRILDAATLRGYLDKLISESGGGSC